MSPRVSKPKGESNPKPVTKQKPTTPKTVPPANNGKHPGGRPSKYTPELVAQICKDLEVGNMRRAVAAANGINKDTIQDWINTKPEFSDQVRRSEEVLAYLDGLAPKPIAAKLLVGSMEPYRKSFPQVEPLIHSIADLPIEVNTWLKPDQWLVLDAKGNIIAAGRGVE